MESEHGLCMYFKLNYTISTHFLFNSGAENTLILRRSIARKKDLGCWVLIFATLFATHLQLVQEKM